MMKEYEDIIELVEKMKPDAEKANLGNKSACKRLRTEFIRKLKNELLPALKDKTQEISDRKE
jgi:hypothetical protein